MNAAVSGWIFSLLLRDVFLKTHQMAVRPDVEESKMWIPMKNISQRDDQSVSMKVSAVTSGNGVHNEAYRAVKSTSKYAAGCCSIHHDPAVWLWEEAAVCETGRFVCGAEEMSGSCI